MQKEIIKREKGVHGLSLLAIFCLFFTLFATALSPYIAKEAKEALVMCGERVIPSLFPFILLSAILTESGAAHELGRLFYRPLHSLFGVSRGGGSPVILGFLTSYPAGAKCVASLIDKKELSAREGSRLLTFICNPSAAFIIGGVGGVLGDTGAGVRLYISVIGSAVICGIFSKAGIRDKDTEIIIEKEEVEKKTVSEVFSRAVMSAASAMLNVCACAVAFSTVAGVICSLPLMNKFGAALGGILEISTAISYAPSIPLDIAPYFCAAALSWSGLSVHMQVMSSLEGRGLSFVPFTLSKAVQSILSPLIFWVLSVL